MDANQFAFEDGLTVDDVTSIIDVLAAQCRLRGAALTAYDPACDIDDRVCRTALGLLTVLADTVSASERTAELTGSNTQRGRGG